MKLPLALFAILAPLAWGNVTIINSPVEAIELNSPQRLIVLEGAVIGDGSELNSISVFGGGIFNIDIYGGEIPDGIGVAGGGKNRITIKGGVIGNVISIPDDPFSTLDNEIEIYGTDLRYSPNLEEAEEGIGTISGTLADGNVIDVTFFGDSDSLRFFDPEDFEDVTVCRGPAAFADEVCAYDPGPDASQIVENLLDPQQALGTPNWVGAPNDADTSGAVSLGDGGSIIIKFVNNGLIGDGSPKPDIIIYESGNIVEQVDVEISVDGDDWINVGRTTGGTDALDIDDDNIDLSDTYFYVRVTDVLGQGGGIPSSSGAEVDAVATLFDRGFNPATEVEACVALEVKFQTYLGNVYQIERSTDMETWEIDEDNVQGTGGELSRFYPTSDPRSFYRIMPKLASN